MTRPVVSVVVPARDAERFVADAVDSVRRQTLTDWELVVVDDGSSDETAKRATRSGDPRIRVIHEHRIGVSGARNAGFAASSGDLVLFLDADDRLRPRTLEVLRNALDSQQSAVVAYASYVKIDERGRVRGPDRPLELTRSPSGRVLEPMLAGCFVKTPGAALVRRDALDRVGAFDPSFVVAEDWELWCRLAAVGEFVHVRGRDALVEYRLHGDSATRRYRFAAYLRAIEHVFGSPEIRTSVPPRRLARLRRRQVAFVFTLLAIQRLREGDVQCARGLLRRAVREDRTRGPAYVLLGLAFLPRVPQPIATRVGIWSE